MKPYKEIFNHLGVVPNKPKYEGIMAYYQHIFTDPQDQDHGLDAMVINSILRLWKREQKGMLAEKLTETMGIAYETAYMPLFAYYAKALEVLVTINQIPGKIVFLERDAGHLADVALLLPGLKDKISKAFWPRSISSGQSVDLDRVVNYQNQIFNGAGVIADTGMYGIQVMSLHTGRECFHYQQTGQYWGGLTNAKNIPQSLLDGLFAGSKLLPIFLISSTHWQTDFQIPGVLNHLVYHHKSELIAYANDCGIGLDTEEKQENFIKQLLSLTLDSIERLLPSTYANSGVYDSETGEVKVELNDDPLVLAILQKMKDIRHQHSQEFIATDLRTSDDKALIGIKHLIKLSINALETGVFTGILPIGVPGKYAGNEDQIIDEIPNGGKQDYLAVMARIADGNSLLHPPGPNLVTDLPLPSAEKIVAQVLFNNFKWL